MIFLHVQADMTGWNCHTFAPPLPWTQGLPEQLVLLDRRLETLETFRGRGSDRDLWDVQIDGFCMA